MWNKLIRIWKIQDLRKSILFVFALLVVYRLCSNIPLPGVDPLQLRRFFESNQLLGLINIFSGGGISNFSIVAMGVAPYITASIIFQLLAMIVPKIEAMSKETDGRQKINQLTRLATVPLALLQAYGLITLLKQSNIQFLQDFSAFQLITTLFVLTAGTVFLVFLGELISEKNIGNGISLIIFAGIVSQLPTAIERSFFLFDKTQITSLVVFLLIALVTILGVVFITEGQRNIPVSYARQIRGSRTFGGVNTYLPLRVNQAGVIPIIFAISIILFPPLVAQFFAQARTPFLANLSQEVIRIFQNQNFYAIVYFVLVVGFTYFYTSVVFQPQQIAENLQKQGGFIPGIRPGTHTASYLNNVMNRITLAGAVFLGVIAVLPFIVQNVGSIGTILQLGGTSLLIVVSVVLETMKQIDAQLTMRDYDGF